jgi:hypothetical protein
MHSCVRVLSKIFTTVLIISIFSYGGECNESGLVVTNADSLFERLKLNFSVYKYEGEYSADLQKTTIYESNTYKMAFDYKSGTNLVWLRKSGHKIMRRLVI